MRQLPVGAGRLQLAGSVGGPLVTAFDAVIPVPYTVVGGTYGVSERLNAHCDLHVTAAAYKFMGITPGVTWFPDLQTGRWVPSLVVDGIIFSDFKVTRLFPELVTAVARPLGTRWVPYAGVRHTFQSTHRPVHIPSLFAGTSVRLGRLQLVGEIDWLAMNRDNRWNPVEYKSLDHHGALGAQFGMTLDVGRARP